MLLLKDPLFFAALVVFSISVLVFFWCLWHLRPAPAARLGGRPYAAPVPAPSAPPARPPSVESDAAVMFGLLEERFTDLSKRLASLEQGSAPAAAAAAPADLEPLMKRLQEIEEEIVKVKQFAAAAPAASPQGSQDLAAIAKKVESLQKILEFLTSETEVAKPS